MEVTKKSLKLNNTRQTSFKYINCHISLFWHNYQFADWVIAYSRIQTIMQFNSELIAQ